MSESSERIPGLDQPRSDIDAATFAAAHAVTETGIVPEDTQHRILLQRDSVAKAAERFHAKSGNSHPSR